ncbi:hypothetical protein RRG08_064222 [Elysia crispata]|uniref:Uncharacterized protein n=1 Tax=Elysia crispata TaxID=231223 RepID=A0AAE1CXY4_9GAST|nr:hypothetical protein RRG08_064222 [Elysia crispata]
MKSDMIKCAPSILRVVAVLSIGQWAENDPAMKCHRSLELAWLMNTSREPRAETGHNIVTSAAHLSTEVSRKLLEACRAHRINPSQTNKLAGSSSTVLGISRQFAFELLPKSRFLSQGMQTLPLRSRQCLPMAAAFVSQKAMALCAGLSENPTPPKPVATRARVSLRRCWLKSPHLSPAVYSILAGRASTSSPVTLVGLSPCPLHTWQNVAVTHVKNTPQRVARYIIGGFAETCSGKTLKKKIDSAPTLCFFQLLVLCGLVKSSPSGALRVKRDIKIIIMVV